MSPRTLRGLLAVSILTNVIFAVRALDVAWPWTRSAEDLQPAPIGPRDHVRGDSSGTVDLIVYTDFECPFCASFHGVLREVVARSRGVRWVYRHHPAAGIHPLAMQAAEAAECAAEQGRFWPYADALFAREARLVEGVFEKIAFEVGLDPARFNSCMEWNQGRTAPTSYDNQLALLGTPTTFVGGKRIDGFVDAAQLERVIGEVRR